MYIDKKLSIDWREFHNKLDEKYEKYSKKGRIVPYKQMFKSIKSLLKEKFEFSDNDKLIVRIADMGCLLLIDSKEAKIGSKKCKDIITKHLTKNKFSYYEIEDLEDQSTYFGLIASKR